MAEGEAGRLLEAFVEEGARGRQEWEWTLDASPAAQAVLEAAGDVQRDVLFAIYRYDAPADDWRLHQRLGALRDRLLRRTLPLGPDDVSDLATRVCPGRSWAPDALTLGALERYTKHAPLPAEAKETLEALLARLTGSTVEDQRGALRIRELLGLAGDLPGLEPGEAFTDAVLGDLACLESSERDAWSALLAHCLAAKGARPSARWRKRAEALVGAVGWEAFRTRLLAWFPAVAFPRTKAPVPDFEGSEWHLAASTGALLRGLVWCCALRPDDEVVRALTPLALAAFRRFANVGPRSLALGNACILVLGMVPGEVALGQLAVLKVKVRHGAARKQIEKALDLAAEREGVPRDQVEELSVPDCGLEAVGRLERRLGAHTAQLVVEGAGPPQLRFRNEAGRALKSVPAAVKRDFHDELSSLKTSLQDLKRLLPAQRERLDRLYLEPRTWPYAIWAERYHDHPVVGVLARRLIWRFTQGEATTDALWLEERWIDSDGDAVDVAPAHATVSLWHPLEARTDVVGAWRTLLDEAGVVQPFKQAHREVYLLTDAERQTGSYSNRFAAHILKQHQFNALCGARGWKNALRLMVDDEVPPATRALPHWGLRAEFWIEGAGDEYGVDTNELGTFLYVSTDQVRFYGEDAATNVAHASGGSYRSRAGGAGAEARNDPLPLERVPAMVLSEVLRDCDLFVGVASVGNDPTWEDGGPEGRYRDYWQRYSFGELSATAETRREVLQGIVPRLKIAPRCRFEGRFLVVEGSVRTYKIHLGSGNVLMAPNDAYLCIVVDRRPASARRVQLPFEGDATLSLILSKALLLADDAKIQDPVILQQLRR